MASNLVYNVKMPHVDDNGKTVWLNVGTITLLGHKDHNQGLMRLNMWPSQTYQLFLREDGNPQEA